MSPSLLEKDRTSRTPPSKRKHKDDDCSDDDGVGDSSGEESGDCSELDSLSKDVYRFPFELQGNFIDFKSFFKQHKTFWIYHIFNFYKLQKKPSDKKFQWGRVSITEPFKTGFSHFVSKGETWKEILKFFQAKIKDTKEMVMYRSMPFDEVFDDLETKYNEEYY